MGLVGVKLGNIGSDAVLGGIDLMHVLLGDGALDHLSVVVGPGQVHLRALRGHDLAVEG